MAKKVITKTDFKRLDKFEANIAPVEVPELKGLFGDDTTDDIPVIVVRQLTLSQYLERRIGSNNEVKNLMDGIVAAAANVGDVQEETLFALQQMSQEERYRIEIVAGGIVEPKLDRSEIIALSKKFPLIVMRLVDKILELTSKGASLKKNS